MPGALVARACASPAGRAARTGSRGDSGGCGGCGGSSAACSSGVCDLTDDVVDLIAVRGAGVQSASPDSDEDEPLSRRRKAPKKAPALRAAAASDSQDEVVWLS
eukprot:7076316-Prymnesium_polylepis.1